MGSRAKLLLVYFNKKVNLITDIREIRYLYLLAELNLLSRCYDSGLMNGCGDG